MKVLQELNLDLSPLASGKTTRQFSVVGSAGAVFNLDIKNGSGYYYNFVTKAFQAETSGLRDEVIGSGVFQGEILFPSITNDDQYDVFLFAQPLTTEHTNYSEVRFEDGSLDINSSKGSNSLLMTKVIYQYVDQTLTLNTYSIGGTIPTSSPLNTVITLNRGSTIAKQPFTLSCSVSGGSSATQCYQVIKQPTSRDVLSFVSPVIGAAPITIEGEDIYPAITETALVQTSGISNSTTIVLRGAVPDITVGDLWYSDGAMPIAAQYVQSVTTEDGNVTQFVTNTAASHLGNAALTFKNQMNYQWPINNFVHVLKDGMIVVAKVNVTPDTLVGAYEDTVTEFVGTKYEKIITKYKVESVNKLAIKPVMSKGEIVTQQGAVTFNKQQVLALGGQEISIGGYGEAEALRIHGYDLIFSDLAITLAPVTTTTTAASSGGSSTSVAVASRNGILDDVSVVSGIGINPSLANPIVDSGAGAVYGSGTLVLTEAQSLESGQTLTFTGAGLTATITGNLQILKTGNASAVLSFDVNKLLSIT